MTKVFVYGTLLKGQGNHCLLDGATLLCGAKTAPQFTMLHMGGFPGVTMEGDTAIVGEVYEVDEDIEKELDCLEGIDDECPEDGHYRKEYITLDNGQTDVLIYIINDFNTCGDENAIISGSWSTAAVNKHRYR